jgi:hypothetical protein
MKKLIKNNKIIILKKKKKKKKGTGMVQSPPLATMGWQKKK